MVWTTHCQQLEAVKAIRSRDGCLPVKVRPKTSSSCGSKVFGVVVFCIDSLDGSIPASWGADAASVCTE